MVRPKERQMINTQQLVPGTSTATAVAAVVDGSTKYYWLAFTKPDQSLWWAGGSVNSAGNGYNWGAPKQLQNAASSAAPAIAMLSNGTPVIAWKGESKDTRIFILLGTTGTPTPIPGIGTSSGPALAATSSGELLLTWKGESDSTIYWSKSSDGKTWSQQKPVSGAGSTDAPALASFGGTVAMAWKGASDRTIWAAQYTDANGWGKPVELPSNYQTSAGPALGFGDSGNLHIVWKGGSSDDLWVSEADGDKIEFTFQARIPSVATGTRPALATQPSSGTDILMAWVGATPGSSIYVAPLDNLGRILPLPAGSQPVDSVFTWNQPVTGFGSGPNNANYSFTLKVTAAGEVTFSGQYSDTGSLPFATSPTQTFNLVVCIAGPNKKGFTFAVGAPVPSAQQYTWNTPKTSPEIAQAWDGLVPITGRASCSNSNDLLALISAVESEIEEAIDVVEGVIEFVEVIEEIVDAIAA